MHTRRPGSDAPGKTPARGVSTLMNTPHFAKSGNRAARQNVETPLAGVCEGGRLTARLSECARLTRITTTCPIALIPHRMRASVSMDWYGYSTGSGPIHLDAQPVRNILFARRERNNSVHYFQHA